MRLFERRRPLAGLAAGLSAALGCGGSDANREAPPPLAVTIATAPSASASVRAEEPSAPTRLRFALEKTPRDDDARKAPCDFHRAYRGTIGKTVVSYVLDRSPKDPAQIVGLVHYDDTSKAAPVAGRVEADGSFTLTEKPGGDLRGRCDDSGTLVGTFVLAGKSSPFRLRPGLAGAPGLFSVSRRDAKDPNHPACRGKTKPREVVVIPGPEPPPEDPDRFVPSIYCMTPAFRKELAADGTDFRCRGDFGGTHLFGMTDTALELRLNTILDADGPKRAFAQLNPCAGGSYVIVGTSIKAISADTAVVTRSETVSAAEAMHSYPDVKRTFLDLHSGTESSLADAVDLDKLRATVARCLPVYDAAWKSKGPSFEVAADLGPRECSGQEDILWGCEKDDRPDWTVVSEGLVVAHRVGSPIGHGLEGTGPIIGWDVLLREKVIRPGSPLASFAAGVQPAKPEAPVCSAAITFSEHLAWKPIAP